MYNRQYLSMKSMKRQDDDEALKPASIVVEDYKGNPNSATANSKKSSKKAEVTKKII